MATKKAAKKAPAKKAAAKKVPAKKVPAKKSTAKKAPAKGALPKSGPGGMFKPLEKSASPPIQDVTNNQARTAKKAAENMDQYIRS